MRQHLGVADVDDKGVPVGTLLCLEDFCNRLSGEGVGTEAVDRLGGEGDNSALTQDLGGAGDVSSNSGIEAFGFGLQIHRLIVPGSVAGDASRILVAMQSAEIEVKIPIASVSTFERQLDQAGFHLETPRTFEQNTLYDTPGRDLKARGEILRVRKYGERHVVTHKRHPDDEDQASIYKVRIETESEVADGAALAEMFTRLGFGPAFRYEKYRSEYTHPDAPGAHLVLDETPIGDFAELEGPPEWIDRTLSLLGVDPLTCITLSYGKLFLAWKDRTLSPANNLTFDEVAAPVLVAR